MRDVERYYIQRTASSRSVVLLRVVGIVNAVCTRGPWHQICYNIKFQDCFSPFWREAWSFETKYVVRKAGRRKKLVPYQLWLLAARTRK